MPSERAIDRGREGAEGLPFLLALMYSSHIDYEIEYVTREGRPLRQSEAANHGQKRRASERACEDVGVTDAIDGAE